jgi:hypothetical protein
MLERTGTFTDKFSGNGSLLTNIPFTALTGPATYSTLKLSSTTQISTRLSFTGQEYSTSSFSSTNGIDFLLGVNRDNNRKLWICDTAKAAQNTTNSVLRVIFGGTSESGIDAVATDGLTRHALSIGGNTIRTDSNAWGSLRNNLRFHDGHPNDDVAVMNKGAFAGGVLLVIIS